MQQNNSARRPSNSSEEPFLKFLTESHYLESEQSSQETQQTLTKCKTEHALQPVQQFNSNSFTIFDKKHKFTFPTHEILEWETLQLTLTNEVFTFLLNLKQLASTGILVHEHLPKELCAKLLEKGWITKTTRHFNDTPLHFYSLAAKRVTYENLVWILKSIRRDMITPTERMVQSRIKECFGIKLRANEWELIMNSLKGQKQPLKFRNAHGKLIELPLLAITATRDPLIKEDTYAIHLSMPPVPVEDEVIENLEKRPEWALFVDFLKDFFSQRDKTKLLKGGRYGCAQYIKLQGPKRLRELSLGRLTLYVQMAVNKGYIKYNKTILMQESLGQERSCHTTDSSLDADPAVKIKVQELQLKLIELLFENPEGVSLAQIPTLLRERMGSEMNLGELGFPKLKNFIESVKELIHVENMGKNNYIARVIAAKVPPRMLQRIQEGALQKVISVIKATLSKHKYGLSMNQLYHDLSAHLGEWFPYQRFQCQSFFQFLQQYTDVVIVCQREGQHQSNYWIYERNLRFMPPPSPSSEMNDQQFEQMLSEAFPCSIGLSGSFSSSWLGKASDSRICSPQRVEDSHQEIKENLKFIDELLGNDSRQYETTSIQDWSEKSMNPWGMLSSINYGDCDNNFDLNKELQEPKKKL